MFVPGRVDKHKKFKKSQDDINCLLNAWGEEVIQELNHTALIQLSRAHKSMKDEVNKLKTNYNVLLSSALSCGVPNITIHSNMSENNDISPSNENKCNCNGKALSWETIRNAAVAKCNEEMEIRNDLYETEAKKVLISEFYPSVVKDDPYSSLKDDMSIESCCVMFIATKYQEICKLYIKEAKKIVSDKSVTQSNSNKDICSFPIIYPCKWVIDFCNIIEVPKFADERGQVIQHMNNNSGVLKNKLYTTVNGFEVMQLSNHTKLNRMKSVHKIYAMDLPYHMCRFLSIFGSAIFVPEQLHKNQFKTIERYTDTHILIHFALKSHEDLYDEFLKDQLMFCKTRRSFLIQALNKATNLLISSNRCSDVMFNINKDGNTKLYKKTIDNQNCIKPTGTEQAFKKKLIEVPHEVMRVLRTFILPDIDEYKQDCMISTVTDSFKMFEQKYSQYIMSPIGKLINFEKQSQKEFSDLDKEQQGETSIHRYLNPKAAFLPCMVNIYTFLLQAAYGIREICDPINLDNVDVTFLLDELIVKGEDIGYPSEISYLSVFEAFPGLFYYSTLSKSLQDSLSYESDISTTEKKYSDIFRLFENYISFVPKIVMKSNCLNNLHMTEFINPPDIRWVNAGKILLLIGTCKKEIQGIRCSLLNGYKKKHEVDFETNKSKWNYFISPISPKHILKTELDIEKSYFSPNLKCAYGAFYRTPITMGMDIKVLQTRDDTVCGSN